MGFGKHPGPTRLRRPVNTTSRPSTTFFGPALFLRPDLKRSQITTTHPYYRPFRNNSPSTPGKSFSGKTKEEDRISHFTHPPPLSRITKLPRHRPPSRSDDAVAPPTAEMHMPRPSSALPSACLLLAPGPCVPMSNALSCTRILLLIHHPHHLHHNETTRKI